MEWTNRETYQAYDDIFKKIEGVPQYKTQIFQIIFLQGEKVAAKSLKDWSLSKWQEEYGSLNDEWLNSINFNDIVIRLKEEYQQLSQKEKWRVINADKTPIIVKLAVIAALVLIIIYLGLTLTNLALWKYIQGLCQ